jgi:glycosyltransferase involved in cell wall biosynthesis
VLHLVANRWWTGSADPVIRLVRGLEARGHQVRLALVPGDRFEAKAREAGIEPVAGLSLDVKSAPWAWTRDVARLRALVRRDAVDVIHTHHSHDHWLGALSRGGAALARTFHNQRAVKRGPLRRALYRHTDAVLVVSRQIEERCRLAGIRPERIFRVSGVIDLLRFTENADPARVRGELGLDGSAPSGPSPGSPTIAATSCSSAVSAGCCRAIRAPGSSSSARARPGCGSKRWCASSGSSGKSSSPAIVTQISPPCSTRSTPSSSWVRAPTSPAGRRWRPWPPDVRWWPGGSAPCRRR